MILGSPFQPGVNVLKKQVLLPRGKTKALNKHISNHSPGYLLSTNGIKLLSHRCHQPQCHQQMNLALQKSPTGTEMAFKPTFQCRKSHCRPPNCVSAKPWPRSISMPKDHEVTPTLGLRGAGEAAAPPTFPAARPPLHTALLLLQTSKLLLGALQPPGCGSASSPGPTPPAEIRRPQARPWPRRLRHRDSTRQECA